MCGQFSLAADQDILELQRMLSGLRARIGETAIYAAMGTGHIYPADVVPVWAGKRAEVMKWGFAPPVGGRLLINARVETLREKPIFAQPLQHSRCLVPAAFFYEWQKMGKERVRYACRVKGEPLFYMAGLYHREPQIDIPAFTILTLPAQGSLAQIHDRMPVILPRELLRPWLTEDENAAACLEQAVTDLVLEAI